MGKEELEEGREKERKVWEREKYKTSETQEWEAGGFPRQGLRLDQMQRTMGLSRLESRKGRGREVTQSGQGGPGASGAKAMGTPMGPCGQGLPQGQCKSQRHPQVWEELCRS